MPCIEEIQWNVYVFEIKCCIFVLKTNPKEYPTHNDQIDHYYNRYCVGAAD